MQLSVAGVSVNLKILNIYLFLYVPPLSDYVVANLGTFIFLFLPDSNIWNYPTKELLRTVISVNTRLQPPRIATLPQSLTELSTVFVLP